MPPEDLISDFRKFRGADDQDRAHTNLLGAREIDPEKAAKFKALGDRWGVGITTAERQQPALERAARVEADKQALSTAPATSRFLAKDPSYAAVSHDHISDLTSAEVMAQRVAQFGALTAPKQPRPTIGSYLKGQGTALSTGLEMLRASLMSMGYDISGGGNATERETQLRKFTNADFRNELATPDFKTRTAGAIYGGVSSTLQTAPAMTMSVLTRNPAPALAVMGAQSGLQQYGAVRARGGTPGEAAASGVLTGGIEAGTELIPMGFLAKRFGEKGFKAFIGGMLARELPTEQVATFLQDAVDTAIANPDKTWGEFWAERPGAAFDTAVSTVTQSLIMGGLSEGAARIARKDQTAAEAPDALKAFNEFATAVTALPLRQRSPEAFQALVSELAPGVDVHVNAEALTTYLQSLPPEEASTLVESLGVEDQIKAATPEVDIVIPMASYMQHIAPTEGHKVLEQDIKLGTAGMSVKEAEAHQGEREQLLAEAAAKVMDTTATQAPAAEARQRVYDDFYARSVAAGVPEEQAKANAAVQASYYEQRAARNTAFPDAWAAYQEANVSIQGPGGKTAPVGDVFNLFAQGGKRIPTPRNMLAQVSRAKNKELRGLLAPDGSLHLWDANDAIHSDKARELGIPYDVEKNDNRVWVRIEDGLPHIELGEGQKLPAEYAGEDLLITAPGMGTVSTREYRAAGFEQRDPPKAATGVTVHKTPPEDYFTFIPETGGLFTVDIDFEGGRQPLPTDGTAARAFGQDAPDVFWHGSVSGDLRGGQTGLHLGTKEAARQALNARIGVPAQGEWDGTREYGKTLLAGQKTLKRIEEEQGRFVRSGFNVDAPEEDYYPPAGKLKYSDGSATPYSAKPNIQPFRLKGAMSNTRQAPHEDFKANGYMAAQLKKGTAKRGYYYKNVGEDGGSISVVVPNGDHVEPVDTTTMGQGPRGQVSFSDQGALIQLFKTRNASTLIHEGAGHIWLENLGRDAADPNASDEVRADLELVKAWWRENAGLAGNEPAALQAIEDFGTGRPVDTDAIRPFHELFARAAERYFMEGKSPTPELRGAFTRFRNWLVAIYKDFTALKVPMTDDIRGVFDRLIAVPQELESAAQDQGLTPFFKDAASAGFTPAEYAAYLTTLKTADETAHDRLLGKVMGDIRRKYTAAWKAERETLVEEFQAQVDATPEMQALTLLESGEVRLQRDAVNGMAEGGEATLYRRQRPYVFDEGLHPDDVAEQVGLPSGQSLVDALVAMKGEHDDLRANGDKRTVRKARAERLADAEMLARHGDILNDGTIGDEAIAALNDLRRSEVLMAEVRALVRKAGAITTIWSQEEMQSWARAQVAARRLDGIRPHIYAAAEAKAGRDALKALVKDDFQGALDAKFRQLLNMHLFRAARDAREQIDKGKTLFEHIAKAKNGTISKTRNMDMVGAARAVLTPYGFAAKANDADYMTKVKLYDPELWADLELGVTAALAGAKPIDELTYDEFASLREIVGQLWDMSRVSKQMEIDFQTLEIDDITTDLADQLKDPKVNMGPTHNATGRELIARTVQAWRAHMRRVESWVSSVDGGQKGPFRTYIWQPISDAATRYRLAKNEYLTAFVALLEPMRASLKRGKIEAPELNHVFGGGNNGVGKSELLHAILHTGNESNKRKLLLGRGWAVERADGTLDTSAWDKFLDRMHREGVLTKADYDFAQEVWDLLERMKPDAQKAHRRVFGRYFEEVTANSFNTPFGTYKGGYVPALVDTFVVQDAALKAGAEAVEEGNSANMFPSPARGFTKSRVEYNRPLALDLGLLPMHIDKVLKFSHLTGPVRDVLRLLKAKGLSSKLEAVDPTAVTDMLLPWLNRAARQVVETPSSSAAGRKIDSVMRAVRSRSGMGIMMFNLSNTVQQLTGWFPAALKIKKRHLTRALWNYTTNAGRMAEDIAAMSPFMATRTTKEMIDVGAQLDQLLLDPTKYQQVEAFTTRHAYVLQGMFQNLVDLVAWQAGFEQAIENGDDFQEAVRAADSIIRETQGSLSPEDVSAWETGSALKRLFTQFFSYFSAQGNLIATEGGNAKTLSRAGYIYLMGVLLPAVVSDIIRRSFGAGWDDDDDDGYLDMFLDLFFGSQFRYATGALPIVGQLVNLAANQFNDKRFDDQLVPSPAMSTIQSAANVPHDLYRVVAQGKGQKAAVRDTATLLTLATGIPLFNVAARPLGYLADVNEGKVKPTGPVDLARGLMTGTASSASKVN